MSGTLTLKADAQRKVVARLALNRAPLAPKAEQSRDDAKRERRAAVKIFRTRLAIECPHTFSAFDHGPRVALAIGIRDQLAARYPDVPNKTRRLLLKQYTNSAAYLQLLTVGASRLDVAGNVTGTVTDAEAEHAAERLKDLFRGIAPQKGGK